MKNIKNNLILAAATIIYFGEIAVAHEPLYGIGPDVLANGIINPHLTIHFSETEWENEIALGYGITRNWTGISELSSDKDFHLQNWMLKSNYRFFKVDKPGLSYKAAFISELSLPVEETHSEEAEEHSEKIWGNTLTAGQESLRYYWFVHLGYEYNFSSPSLANENQINYGITLGIRPFKPHYYKPDLVFLLETTGNYEQKSLENEEVLNESGGTHLDIAPTFILTYRNVALRGGVQFGIYHSEFVSEMETNGKITLEIHL